MTYRILAVPTYAEQTHEIEICRVDGNPQDICAALAAKKLPAKKRRMYLAVRYEWIGELPREREDAACLGEAAVLFATAPENETKGNGNDKL